MAVGFFNASSISSVVRFSSASSSVFLGGCLTTRRDILFLGGCPATRHHILGGMGVSVAHVVSCSVPQQLIRRFDNF